RDSNIGLQASRLDGNLLQVRLLQARDPDLAGAADEKHVLQITPLLRELRLRADRAGEAVDRLGELNQQHLLHPVAELLRDGAPHPGELAMRLLKTPRPLLRHPETIGSRAARQATALDEEPPGTDAVFAKQRPVRPFVKTRAGADL